MRRYLFPLLAVVGLIIILMGCVPIGAPLFLVGVVGDGVMFSTLPNQPRYDP